MIERTKTTSEDAWAILAQIINAGWDDQRQAITDGLASLEAMCSPESVWALWTLQCRARREQVRRHAGLALEASATADQPRVEGDAERRVVVDLDFVEPGYD